MTKTEAKRLVAELRREAAKVTTALTPTPAWILREIDAEPWTPQEVEQTVAKSLRRIDEINARLKAGLLTSTPKGN